MLNHLPLIMLALQASGASLPQLPIDTEARVGGVELACTGVGLDARNDPRWLAYGVRVELSNGRNEYVVGGTVTVKDAVGRVLVAARCDAPWLLLRLAPARYVVSATVEGAAAPRSAPLIAPASGQLRVVLQFLEL